MLFNSLATLLSAQRGNHSVAFCADENINWHTFLNDVRSLMSEINTVPCSAVAICCDDSYFFAVAFFAVIYTDKQVLLPGNHQPAMLHSLASQFELLIDDGLVSEKIVTQSITLPIASINNTHFDFPVLDLSMVDIILFTSGSTGVPKAIHKTLLMLDAEIIALEKQWAALLCSSRILSTVSHQHIYGLLFRVLWPLCAGRAFSRYDLTYPEQVISHAQQQHTLISSPALLKRLQDEGIKGQYSAVFSSGGPLSCDAADLCKRLLNSVAIEVFGSTETGGIGFRQQHNIDKNSETVWTFFPDVIAKSGNEQCLALTSPWLCGNKEDAGYYQTSEQCELLEKHQFRLKGRIDRIVKIEEKRISLVEVETHINELDWVSESAVIVVNEAQRITLGALLTLSPLGEQQLELRGKGRFWIQIRQALRQWIEPVGIPRHFRIALEIPVNKQGKRLHQEIAELFK